jgi:hypothetical protein
MNPRQKLVLARLAQILISCKTQVAEGKIDPVPQTLEELATNVELADKRIYDRLEALEARYAKAKA